MWPVFLSVLYTMTQLLVPFIAGVIFRRAGGVVEQELRSFSRLIVNVTLPIFFFVRVARADLSEVGTFAIMPIAALIHVAMAVGLSFLLARLLQPKSLEVRSATAAVGSFGNTGYLPLSVQELIPFTMPLLAEAVGPTQPSLYIGIYVLIHAPIMWSLGNYLVTGRGTKLGWQAFVPTPVIGIGLGLIASLTGLGELSETSRGIWHHTFQGLDTISRLTVPLVLITLGGVIGGLQLPGRERRSAALRMALVAAVVRLGIMPAAFWLVATQTRILNGMGAAVLWVIFLEFHTPTANNISVMATRAARNQNEIALTLVVSYLAYLVLFPLYLTAFLLWQGYRAV